MRRPGAVWAGVAGAALLLTAWVTTAAFVPPLRGAAPGDRDPTVPTQTTATAGAETGEVREIDDRADSNLSFEAKLVMYVFLVLLAVALAVIIFRRVVLVLLTDRKRRRGWVPSGVAEFPDLALAGALAESTERGLAELRVGEPRNAIIRCWTILEDTIEGAGLPRDAALTSEEYTAAVLGRFPVDERSLHTLAGLYREARFSAHPLDEGHRRRALEALEGLRTALRSLATETAPAASEGERP